MKPTATTARTALKYLAETPDGATIEEIMFYCNLGVSRHTLHNCLTNQRQLGRITSDHKKPATFTITEQGRKHI